LPHRSGWPSSAHLSASPPPFYFPLGQAEIVEYVQDLTRELPLPLMVYNMPAMTQSSIAPATAAELARIPGVVGLKDSSGNMIAFHEILAATAFRPDFSVLIGPEELLAESVWFGGDGGVPGGANLFPELYVAQYKAALAGNRQRILELQRIIMHVRQIYFFGKYASSMIKGVKCALRILGICGDTLAEPFHVFGTEQTERISTIVRDVQNEIGQTLGKTENVRP
jgi:4-hydroxy-tetrahydrodipicolinate synthase